MSPELKEALREWLADATSEEPSREVRIKGLCGYIKDNRGWALYEELDKIFEEMGGDPIFPFTSGFEYYDRRINETQHQCPARLTWVREQLGEA